VHGHCYPQDKLPRATPGELFSPCDDPSEACVPDELLLAGGKKLKSCTQPDAVKAVTGDGGGCVTIALLPEVQRQAGPFLKQQECEPDQVCMPCKNPQDNSHALELRGHRALPAVRARECVRRRSEDGRMRIAHLYAIAALVGPVSGITSVR
jgi:hypothetical protein